MQRTQKYLNKISPSLRQFKSLSKSYESIALSVKIDEIKLDGVNFFNEYPERNHQSGIMTFTRPGDDLPYKTVLIIDSKDTISTNGINPINTLRSILKKEITNTYCNQEIDHLGAFGYISYECYKYFENVGDLKEDPTGCPESFFLIPKTMITIDHQENTLTISHLVSAQLDEKSYQKESETIFKIIGFIQNINLKKNNATNTIKKFLKQPTSLITKKGTYLNKVKKIKQLIKEGELIQCVFSQRFEKKSTLNDELLLTYLVHEYPSEYIFQLIGTDFTVTGSSPEMFLKVKNNKATIRPVAGTVGVNKKSNKLKLATNLKESIKDNAEHIMLVDLARNDLGRVSEKGTVKVDKLLETQNYNNVIHLASEVSGKIAKKFDSLDTFMSTFPIGTLTGAPKIRAAKLISALESEGRGPYCGAIGWFSANGDLETSTIIRTAIRKNDKISFNAGGGIVYDSIPEVEYQETLYKIKAFKDIRL